MGQLKRGGSPPKRHTHMSHGGKKKQSPGFCGTFSESPMSLPNMKIDNPKPCKESRERPHLFIATILCLPALDRALIATHTATFTERKTDSQVFAK